MATATTKSISGTTTIHPDFLVGSKLRQQHQQSFREHVSAPTSDFARKQLEKMGWSEGTGLGKKRDGMTSHIRVKRRKDQLGLGGSEKPEVILAVGESEWWKDSLGATLAKLGGKKKSKDKKDKKSKKKKSNKNEQDSSSTNPGKTYTDEELFQATGGARFGMRAGITSNLHKWVRTEKDVSVQGCASGESSDSRKKEKEVELSSSTTDNEKKKKSKKRTAEDGGCLSTSETPSSEPPSKKQRKKEKKEKKKKFDVQPNETVDAATTEIKTQKEKKKSKKSKTSRKD